MEGVSYFSREEESIARNIASARQSKTHMVDIGINSDDVESLEFLERARSEIDAWHSRADVSLNSHCQLIARLNHSA